MVVFDDQELGIVREWIEDNRHRGDFTFKKLTERFVAIGMPRDQAQVAARRLGEKIRGSVEDPLDRRLPLRVHDYLRPGYPLLRGGSVVYEYVG